MTTCVIDAENAAGSDQLVLLAPDAVAPDAVAPPPARLAPPTTHPAPVGRTGFVVAADGSYAACLAEAGGTPDGAGSGGWYAERWTLGGPEPYSVALPGNQPEDADAQVLPLPDGRVLIRRGSSGRHDLALLYPTGPGTGEVPVGFLHGDEVRLLPPTADRSAYALRYADGTSTVWLVHGGQGLEPLARVEGRCSGGVWLDRAGRTLALDRELDGRVKTVAVDLGTGEATPLLQITEDSDDRVLMADPDSGLLIVRSDAPGTERLGWGVLGSDRPVRFPVCLRDAPGPDGGRVEPVAVRPGDRLTPESCAVLLRIGTRAALWRPAARRLMSLPTPPGWLTGAAWWAEGATLRLPFTRADEPYGVRDIASDAFLPQVRPPSERELARRRNNSPGAACRPDGGTESGAGGAGAETSGAGPEPAPRTGPLGRVVPMVEPVVPVVPLQQAPLPGAAGSEADAGFLRDQQRGCAGAAGAST